MGVFDSDYYYRLATDNFGTQYSLNAGDVSTKPHNVSVTNTGRFTSDNWQLFFQEGVYFLRNFDYNDTYHLAIDISSSDRSTPVMVQATSEVGHQWIIMPSDSSNTTFHLMNRLLSLEHNSDSFLGNAVDDRYSVRMHPLSQTQSGINWTITQNPDRIAVLPEMTIPYSVIQNSIPASKTTGVAGSSSTTSPGADILLSPGQLTPVTIAGIVVGIVVFLGALVIFVLFWLRYKKHGHGGIRGVPGPTPPPRHGRAELVKEPAPTYNERTSHFSQASTLNNGLSGYYGGNRTRPKQSDEVSIELPAYGRPSVEERSFV